MSYSNKLNLISSKVAGIVQIFDLFGSSFQFQLGKKIKQKKTTIGGVISIAATVVAIIYTILLLDDYDSNKITPKVADLIIVEKDNEITIDKPIFFFAISIQQNYVSDLIKIEKYVKFRVIDTQFQDYPLVNCQELYENSIGSNNFCIDTK